MGPTLGTALGFDKRTFLRPELVVAFGESRRPALSVALVTGEGTWFFTDGTAGN